MRRSPERHSAFAGMTVTIPQPALFGSPKWAMRYP